MQQFHVCKGCNIIVKKGSDAQLVAIQCGSPCSTDSFAFLKALPFLGDHQRNSALVKLIVSAQVVRIVGGAIGLCARL